MAQWCTRAAVSGMSEDVDRILALVAAEPTVDGAAAGVAGVLQRVCTAAARALSAFGVGMSVMADGGVRGVAAASDQACERLEDLQFVLGEGPCIDAFASRRPVLVPELGDDVMRRWPVYTPAVHEGGVRAVFAFPLQVGAARLGVLDVFRDHAGPLSADHLAQALAFAEAAVTTLLDGQERAQPGAAADGLDAAMDYGAALYQAQGMVMVQLGVTLTEALTRIRGYAFAHGRDVRDVARDIVARQLRLEPDQP